MTNTKQINQLLDQWESERNYKPFVRDGILIKDDWDKATPKILFLMKESHKNSNWWDIADKPISTIKNGKTKKIWQNILRWKYLIKHHITLDILPTFPEMSDIPEIADNDGDLTEIAYVNVSKELGESSSKAKHIQNKAIEDQVFLTKQIDLINPDIVVCANTFWAYHPIYNGNETIDRVSELIHTHNNRIIIKFAHPGPPAGNKDIELYSKLLQGLTETPIHSLFKQLNS